MCALLMQLENNLYHSLANYNCSNFPAFNCYRIGIAMIQAVAAKKKMLRGVLWCRRARAILKKHSS